MFIVVILTYTLKESQWIIIMVYWLITSNQRANSLELNGCASAWLLNLLFLRFLLNMNTLCSFSTSAQCIWNTDRG